MCVVRKLTGTVFRGGRGSTGARTCTSGTHMHIPRHINLFNLISIPSKFWQLFFSLYCIRTEKQGEDTQ